MRHIHFGLLMTQSLFLSFPVLITFAGSYDIFSKTISNRICIIIALAFLPAAISLGLDASEIALHFSCALAMLCAGFAVFVAGWVGGGDAKLFAAAALWFGWSEIADYATISAIIGGALALVVIALRMAVLSLPLGVLFPLPRPELPYGVALALAALFVYPHGPWAGLVL
jgi:prepilin peptidase CpaA